jgi:hypothetical protein
MNGADCPIGFCAASNRYNIQDWVVQLLYWVNHTSKDFITPDALAVNGKKLPW